MIIIITGIKARYMKTLLSWLGRYDDLHKPHPYTNSDGFYHKNKTRKGKDKEKDVVSPYHLKKACMILYQLDILHGHTDMQTEFVILICNQKLRT